MAAAGFASCIPCLLGQAMAASTASRFASCIPRFRGQVMAAGTACTVMQRRQSAAVHGCPAPSLAQKEPCARLLPHASCREGATLVQYIVGPASLASEIAPLPPFGVLAAGAGRGSGGPSRRAGARGGGDGAAGGSGQGRWHGGAVPRGPQPGACRQQRLNVGRGQAHRSDPVSAPLC